MKIIVIQDHLRSGGTERQSVYLARAFHRHGHDTTLLTFRPGGILEHLHDETLFEPNHVHLQSFDTGLDWLALGLTRAVKKINPDIILCHGRMANCYAGIIQKALPGCVVIGTLRTGKPLPYLFRESLKAVKAVVANSEDTKERIIQSLNLPSEKITVIYNSLVFRPADETPHNLDLRKNVGAKENTLILVCVAMFRPEKRQRDLIKIVATLPKDLDWKLVLVGDGPERHACERIAASKNLSERVIFSGFHSDPTELYALSDIAVHASERESLSNFLIEAQAHGLPSIVYPAQGIQESMVPGKTGWIIDRDNISAFKDKILELASSTPEEKKERSQLARTFARERFDSEKQVERYLTLFKNLLKK